MARVWISTALCALCALPSGAEPLTQSQHDRLLHLVTQDCGSCHGLHLTGGLGSPITAQALEGRSIAGLTTIILDGIPGTAMPPWRSLLTKPEAEWIAAYLLERPE